MCELFGFNAAKEEELTPWLREFFSHSREHPSGWGYAVLDRGEPVIQREPVPAYESRTLEQWLDTRPQSRTLLAHIRKASVGGISPLNCHPFVGKDISGRTWTLIHNGTIFNEMRLVSYYDRQEGNTDSERLFLYLLDQQNEGIRKKGIFLNAYERFRVVERVVHRMSFRNKLNLLIYDGSQLYAHVNMKGTLYIREQPGRVMLATTPLQGEPWEPLPLATLHVYKEGNLRFKGENHHNLYEPVSNPAVTDFVI